MQQFGPEYWDKNGLYRAPLGFKLCLVFILKPYILWLFAAASRREDLNLMAIFYPNKNDFFIALALGVLAIVLLVCYLLRKPNAAQWPKAIWRYGRAILLVSLVVDLAWLIWQAKQSYFAFSTTLAVPIVFACWALLYVVKSRYLRAYFAEWPELDKTVD